MVKLNLFFFSVTSPSYVSKVPEQRLDESNVGHQMLKKMGEMTLSEELQNSGLRL